MKNKELQELLKQYPDDALVRLDKSVNYPNIVNLTESKINLGYNLKGSKTDVILIKVV